MMTFSWKGVRETGGGGNLTGSCHLLCIVDLGQVGLATTEGWGLRLQVLETQRRLRPNVELLFQLLDVAIWKEMISQILEKKALPKIISYFNDLVELYCIFHNEIFIIFILYSDSDKKSLEINQ